MTGRWLVSARLIISNGIMMARKRIHFLNTDSQDSSQLLVSGTRFWSFYLVTMCTMELKRRKETPCNFKRKEYRAFSIDICL